MTLKELKRWDLIALALLLVLTLGTFLWRARGEPELVYQGKPVRAWLQLAVVRNDRSAQVVLWEVMRNADAVSKARIKKDLVRCVMKSLNTKDNSFWRPYTFVRTNLSPALAKVMPTWQEPMSVRWGAVWWLFTEAVRGGADSAQHGVFEQAMPVLCDLARNHPNKAIRQTATLTLGRAGTFTPEALQIMLRALNSTDVQEIEAGAKWFYRYPVEPERVVPLLVKGFENSFARSDCALALRVYGSRAKFAVERLATFAKDKDPAVSSVATWVLEGIDQEATKKAGVK